MQYFISSTPHPFGELNIQQLRLENIDPQATINRAKKGDGFFSFNHSDRRVTSTM